MTMTADIIARAYAKIGVQSGEEPLTAYDQKHGLDALNAMFHAWKLTGVDLEHTDLAAADAFSLGPEFEEGTVYLLASRLSPDYERPQAFDADAWFRAFQAAYYVPQEAEVDDAIIRASYPRRYTYF